MSGFSLDGQTALVTGAGRGLGLAIACGLARAGAHVVLNGRSEAPLADAADQIERDGGSASALAFDISDPNAVSDAFAHIGRDRDRLDILVNNVGLRDRRGLFEFDLADVRRVLEVDLVAPFNLARHAARLMQRHGYGRIVNMTSIAGPLANSGDAAYTTAKGGLAALTRALAAELGKDGITANAVAPGFFATEANADMVSDPGISDWLSRRTSLARWGEPEEITGAVVFLASPAASYVTGQILAVDGGYMAHF